MAESTTKGLSREKAKKIDQRIINVVEKRLSLPGGTRIVEIGKDLANRLGKSFEMFRHASNLTEQSLRMFDPDTGRRDKVAAQDLQKQGRALKEAADQEKAKDVRYYSELAESYIVETYGEKKRDEFGHIANYGDRVEVSKNGHLHKIW